MSNLPQLPRLTDHGSEIALLAVIAIGTMVLNAQAIRNGHAGEASAYTAILMAIINAIKERWTQRSVDRMGEQLGQSAPNADQATGKRNDPVHTREDG